jgi:hypothetical protein
MLSVFEMQETKFRTSHLTQHYYGNNATLIVGRVGGEKEERPKFTPRTSYLTQR